MLGLAEMQPGTSLMAIGLAALFLVIVVLLLMQRRQSATQERRGYIPPLPTDTQAEAMAAEAAQGQIGEAHAGYYLDFVRLNQSDWTLLEQDLDKILECFQWCVSAGRHRMVVGYMWALAQFLGETGRGDEEKRLLGQALQSARACRDRIAVASFGHNLAMLLTEEGNDGAALALFEESLRLQKTNKDRAGAAHTLLQMAGIYERQGNTRKAAGLRQQATRFS